MTFLDLVREVGQLTCDRCLPDCDLTMHRMEAARYMGIVLQHPHLLVTLQEIAGDAPEVQCPNCQATIRARMADAPADPNPSVTIPKSMLEPTSFHDGPECQHNDGTCKPYVEE